MNDIVVGDVTRGWFPFCFAVHDIKKLSAVITALTSSALVPACVTRYSRSRHNCLALSMEKKKHIFLSNSLRKIFKGSNQAKRCDNHREKDFQKMYHKAKSELSLRCAPVGF